MQTDFFKSCRKELDILVDRMRNKPTMTTDQDRERARTLRSIIAQGGQASQFSKG